MASDPDRRPTAGTGLIGAAVYVRAAAHALVAAGGHPSRATGRGVVEQQPARGGDQRSELRVVESRDGRPGIDALDEEDFAFEDVAVAGHQALIEEGLGDFQVRVRLEPAQSLIGRK